MPRIVGYEQGYFLRYEPRAKSLFYIAEKVLAGEPGFEPRLTESESVVLPLNYSPTQRSGVFRFVMGVI